MNKNKEIVLSYLIECFKAGGTFSSPMSALWYLTESCESREADDACYNLTARKEFEVLAEFAKWGLKND